MVILEGKMNYNIIIPPDPRKRPGPRKNKISHMGNEFVPDPFPYNQKLTVYVDREIGYLPCTPPPGANNPITRIPNGAIVYYKGFREMMAGTKLIVVAYKDSECLVGTGAIKFLVPLRARKRLTKRYQ